MTARVKDIGGIALRLNEYALFQSKRRNPTALQGFAMTQRRALTFVLAAALLLPAAASAQLRNARFAADPTLAKVAAGLLTLKSGAVGPHVKALQQALLDMGFSLRTYPSRMTGTPVGGVDGSWGGQLATAISNFQWHASRYYAGVRADAVLDKATMLALDAMAPSLGKQAWSAGEKTRAPIARWKRGYKLRAVIVKQEHRTFFFNADGTLHAIFSNATGAKATQTRSGLKMVAGKLGLADAQAVGKRLWQDPKAFGDRILNLSWIDGKNSGEEMHGTYARDRMGQDVSHGCARHYNEDIIYMFDRLNVRDAVAIVDTVNDPNLQ